MNGLGIKFQKNVQNKKDKIIIRNEKNQLKENKRAWLGVIRWL